MKYFHGLLFSGVKLNQLPGDGLKKQGAVDGLIASLQWAGAEVWGFIVVLEGN